MSDIDTIIETCGNQPVCLYDGASISNAAELQGALPDGVQVVVIPQPDQAESVQSSAIASGVQQATGSDTVIVIEDRAQDRFAVSSDQDAAAISESLYSQGEADGGVAVASVAATLNPSGGSGDGGDGLPVGGILFGIIGVLAVAGAITGLALGLRKRSRNRAGKALAANRKLQKELSDALDGEDGEFVEDAIERLVDRAEALPDLAPRILGLQGHVSELFVRVRKRGTNQQVRLLQAQYKDTLSKLLKALDDDYYGDILANPQYWSHPEARLTEVQRAVDSVDQQAVENIRQVNESRDLEFQVALDSLIKTVDEAKLSDVYSDRGEGGSAGPKRQP
ncbi:hypothetical protein [Leucobacter sp. GX24907]